MEQEILICNGMLLTMAEGLPVVENGAVRIKDSKIIDCGPAESVGKGGDAQIIDAQGGIIMPGLVNAHTHAPMSMFRGLADDLPLDVWLNEHIFPAEAAEVTPESVYEWTRHSCREMLLGGITTCCDGYFHEVHVARAMADSGIRAVAAQGIIDFPAPGVPDPKENIRAAEAYVAAVKALSPRLTPSLFCHSPYTCSAGTLTAAKAAARKNGALLQIHVNETRNEPELIRELGDSSVVAWLDSLGILDEQTLLVHAVWVDEKDIEIIRERGCGIVHCPESNMKLASGIAPVPGMLDAGITVALGTDGCASNNDLDIFGEMDTAAKLHKVAALDPCVMDARTCLKMATVNGAQVLGLGLVTGTIEPGKLGDIIIIDRSKPHMTPMYDPYSALVYTARASDVSWVLVDGIIKVKEGKLV
ncbi:MAG: amidohydrolase [Desulfobacter sp.]|nr:MAG: amidohydrolase [Desulfobacter sp.]